MKNSELEEMKLYLEHNWIKCHRVYHFFYSENGKMCQVLYDEIDFGTDYVTNRTRVLMIGTKIFEMWKKQHLRKQKLERLCLKLEK
jgi:hypothetical protein